MILYIYIYRFKMNFESLPDCQFHVFGLHSSVVFFQNKNIWFKIRVRSLKEGKNYWIGLLYWPLGGVGVLNCVDL